MKRWSMFFLLGLLLVIFFKIILPVFASIDDEISSLNRQLEELKKLLSQKEGSYQELKQRLNNIINRVNYLEIEIGKKEEEVKKGEAALAYQKKLLEERAKSFYKNVNKASVSLIEFFLSDNLSAFLDNFFYQKTVVDQDKNMIIKIVLYIKNLEETKKKLEAEKNQLASLKIEIDKQAKVLEEEIAETKQKIAQLTERQQQLIAQKLASLNISRSASSLGRCDSDLTNGRDPGFSPKFALFTYGVPNRVGMNQWGAYGRAKAGQNDEEILRAYYNFDEIRTVDTNIKIRVDGLGEYSLEDYVKRVYEVPDSWGGDGFNSLRAQAIAARSYVLAYTNNGQGSICATEQCQVVKSEPKGGFWEQAVNETAGKVMVKNGNPIKAWYSSTHGGYIFSSAEIGWSATDWTKHGIDGRGGYSNFSDLNNLAYDKDSPWFYCDWGWRSKYNKTAWLKSEELADIINVIHLARYLSAQEKEHLYQIDKPNPSGVETWGIEKVKEELRKRGGQIFNRVDNGSVSVDLGYGKTSGVSFTGDGGSVSFDGTEFKNWFNLRAPANIQIVGPLYNLEKR